MKTASLVVLALLSALTLLAADAAQITVHVTSAVSGKPIDRASVIVKYEGNLKKGAAQWETKTNQDGSVTLPDVPQGKVRIQVIATYYQTFGDIFVADKPEQTIEIKLNPPQPQYSEDAKTTTVPK